MKYVSGVNSIIRRVAVSGINTRLLRRIVGFLGMALPVVVVFWGLFIPDCSIRGSISDYYGFRTRDAFVGILFVIGWFLFAYKGYNKIDAIAGKLACIFAIGVAVLPSSEKGWQGPMHFVSAACLFIILAFFSIYLFTRTGKPPFDFWRTVKQAFGFVKSDNSMSEEKIKRNKIYIICGILMLVFLISTGLYKLFWSETAISIIKPVLILEWLMIWAFGISWLIKGETLFRDKAKQPNGIYLWIEGGQ